MAYVLSLLEQLFESSKLFKQWSLTSASLGMMPAANMGFPELIATYVRLITEPLGQSSDMAEF